jgi:type II secretory pathway component PulJ
MKHRKLTQGFTLVELLVAMAITIMMVGLLASIANSTTRAWRFGEGQTETHSSARGALSLIGRELQGAVINLDMGYTIEETGQPNNYVLKFLARRQAEGTTKAAIEKVAYQLAWATRGLLPEVSNTAGGNHQIPVLIRTVNFKTDANGLGLDEVFDAENNDPDAWTKDWGTLTGTVQTGVENGDGDITEVVAENVVGWRIIPIYWDGSQTVVDDPALSSSEKRYFDTYVTSDLKFVRKDKGLAALTGRQAPRALEIRMATVPSSVLPRITSMGEWDSVFEKEYIFDPIDKWSSSTFLNLLKQNIRFFDATYYLASRTP